MDFTNRTLLRLVDAGERDAILTNDVAREIVESAYRFESIPLDSVSAIRVHAVELMGLASDETPIAGQIVSGDSSSIWNFTGSITRFSEQPVADARLVVSITSSVRQMKSVVESVIVENLASVGELTAVDSTIVSEDGQLPTDAETLNVRRLDVLKARFRARFDSPDELDVDAFLAHQSIETALEFVDFLTRQVQPLRVGLDIATIPSQTLVTEDYPVHVMALVVENLAVQLRDTLLRIQTARSLLARTGRRLAADDRRPRRTEFPYLLVFDQPSLSDPDLPLPADAGTPPVNELPELRLLELRRRLRLFGVALAPA